MSLFSANKPFAEQHVQSAERPMQKGKTGRTGDKVCCPCSCY